MKRLLLVVFALSTGVVAAQQSDAELFQQAERRFQSQDFELALDRYMALVREYPVSQYVPDAQYRIAVSLYRLGRYEEALSRLQRVERRFQSTRYLPLVPFWKGVARYQLGEYPAAVADLSVFLQSDRQEGFRSQALLHRALAQLEAGDQDGSIASLETLVAEAGQPADESYGLALLLGLYVRQDRHADAIALYRTVNPTAVAPEWTSRITLYVAESCAATDQAEEAALLFRRLESADPEIASTAYQRLFVYAQTDVIDDTPQEVLSRAERALSGRTDVLQAFWLNVGVESYQQGRSDLAELYFRRVWDFRQSREISGVVPLYLARLFEQRGRADEAEAVLSEYVDRSDFGGEYTERVLLSLGNLRLRGGDYDAAVSSLQSFVSRYRDSEFYMEAVYQLAFALRAVGRQAEALTAIEREYAAGRVSSGNTRILRLKSRIETELSRPEAALQTLYQYLPLAPEDVAARLDFLKLLFGLDRFDRVVESGRETLSMFPDLEDSTPVAYLQVRYVIGLSYVNLQRYELAVNQFGAMQAVDAGDSVAIRQIHPYALYYDSWSHYRLGDYSAALDGFSRLVEEVPEHELSARSAYLGGWSAFRVNDYQRAAGLLQRVQSYETSDSLAVEAGFLLGRVYAAQGGNEAAAVQFRIVYLDYPRSDYADDAWFEYAEAMVRLNRTDDAVAALDALVREYPASNLAEDAMYRTAELLFGDEQYRDAQEAFFAYRTAYPEGRFVDGALYWGARSRAQLDEGAGALLLWERVIDEFRRSPYRADAMNQAAAVYKQRGEYREALNLLSEMIAAYPEAAVAAEARRRSDELVLLISGLSDREAELMVDIEENRRAATQEGRAAIIELGRIVIYEATSAEVDPSSVVPMLNEVAALSARHPAQAAQARFLLAEYYASVENYLQAGNAFLEAAGIDPQNRDLAAYALLRAAQSYATIGKREEVRALVERLQESFPRSEWITEARRLLREDEE